MAKSVIAQSVVDFTLVNADTDADIYSISDGDNIDFNDIAGINVNIRANTNPVTVGSVVFSLSGTITNQRTESVAPYALFGDQSGDYLPGLLPLGNYTLNATPYSSSGGNGTAGTSLEIQFSVILPPPNQPPNAIASAIPISGDAPLSVDFTGSTSTDDIAIVSYSWDFGDGNSDNLADPNHIYTNPGDYSAILTVTDGGGLQDADTLLINVQQPNQAPVAVASSDTNSGDAPLLVNFTGNNSTDDVGISSYLWDFGDGNSDNLADPNHIYTNPGSYSTILTVTDGGGLQDADTLLINVQQPNQAPVAVASSDTNSGDAPLQVNFTGSSSTDDVAITSYMWDFGDGNSDNVADPSHIYTNPGDYSAILTVTDGGGLQDSDTLLINVQQPNQPPVAVASASPLSGESPLLVNFTGSNSTDDVGVTAYTWDFGDTNSSALADPSHTYSSAGSYSVSLIVGDVEGLQDTTFLTIDVQDPVVNLPPVAVASASPLSGEAPLLVNFTGSNSIDDVGVTAYIWDFGDTNSSSLADPSHTYTTSGNYNVSLIVADVEGLQDTTFLAIDVQDTVVNLPPVAVASASPISGESPLLVNFTGSNSTDDVGVTSYAWDFGDTNSSTLADPSHTYTNAGSYNVSLIVSDVEGLQDTTFLTIDVQDNNLPIISGRLEKWGTVQILFEGPQVTETDSINPFLNYRLNVVFTSPAGANHLVPGYFAADGNAAESSADSGTNWAVRLCPDEVGLWNYTVSFRTGTDIAVDTNPSAGFPMGFNGISGSFNIGSSTANLPDNSARGRLQYTGDRYYRFAETNAYYLKAGTDSPENMLAYSDFDNTIPNKDWQPHVQDWNTGDPSWQNGKGQGLVGAIKYLAEQGMNAFSFITMNINGDGQDVWPWAATEHDSLNDTTPAEIANRLRYDVSKLAQWEIIFDHADRQGMFLHFKTQETENDLLLDGGELGIERKLYYRELVARFGHHLALNWNLGEENDIYQELSDPNNTRIKAYAAYINQIDPYDHPIVIHSFPDAQDQLYLPLLGPGNSFTGPSLQAEIDSIHTEVKKWVTESENAGKPWAVANDEQGSAQIGVATDDSFPGNSGTVPDNREEVRYKSLWATLLAGGYGVEYYFGYGTGETDLTAQDLRSRQNKWSDAKIALEFMHQNIPFWEMQSLDDVTSNSSDFCFGKPDEVYLIYSPDGISSDIDMTNANGTYTVQWFDPVNGGVLLNSNVTQIIGGGIRAFGIPPNNNSVDWLILIKKILGSPVANLSASVTSGDVPLLVDFTGSNSTDDVGIASYEWDFGDGSPLSSEADPQHSFNAEGTFTVELTVTDDGGLQDKTTMVIIANDPLSNLPPMAVATSDVISGDAPLLVNFTGSNSTDDNGITAYSWDFDDGNNSPEADPQHSFTNSGTYNVQLIVSDAEGLSDSTSVIIDVQEPEIFGIVNLTMVNADTDTDLFNITQGLEIAENSIQGIGLNIRANTNPPIVGSVMISIAGPVNESRVENVAPYALFGDASGDYNAVLLPTGDYTLMAVSYSNRNTNGTILDSLSLNFSITDSLSVNLPPLAVASASPLSGEAPLLVNFTGSNSTDDVGVTAYTWDFGDTNTSALADPSHTYSSAGSYSVSLIVGDVEGLQDTTFLTIDVQDPVVNLPPVAIASASPLSGEAPLLVNFTGSNSTDDVGVTAYTWDFGDTNTSALADPSHTYSSAGSYSVSLIVDDVEGLQDTTFLTIDVQDPVVNLPPVAVASASPLSGEAPLLVNFTGSNSTDDVGVTVYAWDFGDTNTSALADPSHTYSSAGSYNVSLIVGDVEGLQDTTFLTIDVQDPVVNLPPVAIASASPLSGEVPLLVNFTGSNSTDDEGVTSYAWDFGDGNISAIADPANTYTSSGNYNVRLIVGDIEGLQDTTFLAIDVQDLVVNLPPVAVASASPLSGESPLLVNFTGSNSTDDVGVTAYTWDFGDTNSSALADPSHTYSSAGSYSVSLIVGDVEGLQDTTFLTIDVQDPVVNLPPVAVASATPLSGEAPLLVNFTGSNSTDDVGVTAYAWDFGDTNTSALADPSNTYSSAGSYNVSLIVGDVEGLQDTTSLNIVVNPQQGVVSFTLIDADTDTDLFDINDGMQISESIVQGLSLNIRANTNPGVVGSVFLDLTGTITKERTENVAPYALFGDLSGDYIGGNLPVSSYNLIATAYSEAGLNGTVLGFLNISFSIESQAASRSESDVTWTQISTEVESVTDLKKPRILVSPNPANNEVQIIFEQFIPESFNAEIYSLNGQLIKRCTSSDHKLEGNLLTIAVEEFEEAIYLLIVRSTGAQIFKTKIILDRK